MPKGPSFDPAEKRIAIHVEDHPIEYADFEGTIPTKQYGAGSVIVWDNGTREPVSNAQTGMEKGKLEFTLHRQKLAGRWDLVRISKPGEADDRWMLFMKRDQWARPNAEFDVITAFPDSVLTQPRGDLEAREDDYPRMGPWRPILGRLPPSSFRVTRWQLLHSQAPSRRLPSA